MRCLLPIKLYVGDNNEKNNIRGIISDCYIAKSFCRHDQGQDAGAAEPAGGVPVSGAV